LTFSVYHQHHFYPYYLLAFLPCGLTASTDPYPALRIPGGAYFCPSDNEPPVRSSGQAISYYK